MLEAILAAPDDDAPRLLWADREGGERGELVVIQCALARVGHAPSEAAERERLLGREQQLLEHADDWANLFGLGHVRFVRGFVDRLALALDQLEGRLDEIFERAPTLRGLELYAHTPSVSIYEADAGERAWKETLDRLRKDFARFPPGRITSLDLSPHVENVSDLSEPGCTEYFGDSFCALLADAPTMSELRELVMLKSGLSLAAVPSLARLERLERLEIGEHRLDEAAIATLRRGLRELISRR